MQVLSREKLDFLLSSKGLGLSRLAQEAGIARQSIYKMLKGDSIYNVPFTKLIAFLQVEPNQITKKEERASSLLKKFPLKIQKAILKLQEFCRRHHGSLLLFGSQAKRGNFKVSSDWDLGVYFVKEEKARELRLLKQRIIESVFPYRIDILNLNRAPEWFSESIQTESELLFGSWPSKWRQAA